MMRIKLLRINKIILITFDIFQYILNIYLIILIYHTLNPPNIIMIGLKIWVGLKCISVKGSGYCLMN